MGSVRFGAVTGRHQGQPEAGESGERGPRRRRTAIIGALVAVPLLVAVAFTLGDEPGGSSRAVTPVQQMTPAAEPTYGEYVAPEAGPQPETLTPPPPPTPPPAPAATPRKQPAPRETPRTRERRDCRWEDVPFLERWCRWRGHGDR
ncbi:hypothetical protein GCM10010182_56340 [Actinomadura cremea]|nr:hypothetical protein GCM10010182_56340 [Actinomadura cremea]